MNSSKKRWYYKIARDKYLLLLALPAFAFFLIFAYLPMAGVVMGFQNFKIQYGIFGSEWVGLKWFLQFVESPFFFRLVRNTFLLSFYGLLFGFPVPIIFALMLNEVPDGVFKRSTQSISYLPYFVSVVITVGILVNLLNTSDGVINVLIRKLGYTPINFMNDVKWFRTVYICSGIWQSFGWNAILYIGAISAIDPSLYEAATIDGAGRFNRIRYITIPGITPVIITILILSLGNIINVGYEKVILMYSPATYEVSDIISSYIFRTGINNAQYSYSSAIGFFNSAVNLFFIMGANALSKRITGVYLW